MGSAFSTTAPRLDDETNPRTGAARHHETFATLDDAGLEVLYGFLDHLLELDCDELAVWALNTPLGTPRMRRAELEAAVRAALVTIYRELVARGVNATFAGDVVLLEDHGLPLIAVGAGRCESPVCHLAHDVDGRHQKAAHL